MSHFKYIWTASIAVMLVLIVSTSCSIERKIAREYIDNDSTRTALLIPPDYIFKTSLKEWEIDSIEGMDEWTIDSILWEKSLFLREISDSVFLDYYVGNYRAELNALGFEIYGEDSLSSFLTGKQDAFIVNMAQLELEEYIMPIKEEEQFGEYIYYEVIDLNALNINSWFELSRVNEDEDKSLFFASQYVVDDLEGLFRYNYFTGEVKFQYHIDTIMLDEIYRLGALAGHVYAGYTFDFLLNKYIDKRMLEEGKQRSAIYYHYNRQRNYLAPAKEEERFLPMEE